MGLIFEIFSFLGRNFKKNLFPCAIPEINLFDQTPIRINSFACAQELKN